MVDRRDGLLNGMREMKTKLPTTLCALALVFAVSAEGLAAEEPSALAVAADTLIGRPACFAATVIGSALFVVALPIAAISKSTKTVANTLVVKPANATFTRPLGDFEGLHE
jgi:hypothetical protein